MITYTIGELIALSLILSFKEKIIERQIYKFLMMFTGIIFFGSGLIAFFMTIWIFLFVIVIAMVQYGIALTISKLFKNLESYTVFTIPVGFINIGLSMLLFNNRPIFDYTMINLLPLFALPIEFIIPAILLSFSYLKRNRDIN